MISPAPPIPAPRESGFTTTTDIPLFWAKYGPVGAPKLLVLHGGPGAHHDYLLPQMLELARDYELLFYDQRGGGQSRIDTRSTITWHTHVEDLDRLVAELRIDPISIVGYSWGALLAMLYSIEASAGRTAHTPDRLVLIDPAPISRAHRNTFEAEMARRGAAPAIAAAKTELASSGLRERDPDAYRKRAFELSVAGYFGDPANARDLTPFRVIGRAQQSVWDSLGDFDLAAPGQLDSVSIPTLITHGRQDPIPLASSEAAARALNATLVVIEDSGHVPYVEQPVALFSAVRKFLGSPAALGPT